MKQLDTLEFTGKGDNVSNPAQRKPGKKQQHRACMQAILKSNSFTSALQYKLAFEKEGLSIDSDIYYELLHRCNDNETIMQLKEEMIHSGCKISERIYLCIYKKVNTPQQRYDILKEMELKGIKPSAKLYFVMIKKAENIGQALSFFEKMKSQGIKPDLGIYDELVRKSWGTEYYTPIIKGRERVEQFERLLVNIRSFSDAERSIKRAREANLSYDIEFYNDMILLIDSYEDRIRLLNLILLDELAYNHHTYWNFQKKCIDEGTLDQATEMLKQIEGRLGIVERKMLLDLYKKASSTIIGGADKITLQINKLIYEMKQKINTMNDFKEQLYWTGFIDGLETTSHAFDNAIQKVNAEIHLLEEENDTNLFELNIVFEHGKIEGLKRGQLIVADIRAKELPILVICYIEDSEVLERLRLIATSNGFYQYDDLSVNTCQLNGFIFTQWMTDFEDIIKKVDSDVYDIAVNILTGEDNTDFVEEFGDELIDYIHSFTRLKIIKEKNFLKNPKIVWENMYSHTELRAMSDLIDEDDEEDKSGCYWRQNAKN